MKYAIVNQFGGINRVVAAVPQVLPENVTPFEITDEQAAQIAAGLTSTPPVVYAVENNTLMTMAEKIAARRAARPLPVPKSVPLWAFRVALDETGLLESAKAIVAAANNPALTIFFEYGNFVDRDSPSLDAMAHAMQKTDADIDNLFRLAGTKKL